MANKNENAKKKFSIKEYFRGIKIELKKVIWPTKVNSSRIPVWLSVYVLSARWVSGPWIRDVLLSYRNFSESN